MPVNRPKVSVVMLTHNHFQETQRALNSIRSLTYPNLHVLVLDNGSSDETVRQLPREFPDVDFCCNGTNLGFAAGINVGLRAALQAGAEYLLVLNNDVTVHPRLVESLISAVDVSVGGVAPLIYTMEDPRRIWSAGFRRHPILLTMYGGARGNIDKGEYREPFAVDYVLGCAVLLPARILDRVGLFDESFFFYYEDLDLSIRIRAQGYRLIVAPQAIVWHQGAATAGQGSAFHSYHMARGSVVFFRKHARGTKYPLIVMYRFGSSLKKSVSYLSGHRWDLFWAHWRGIRDGWVSSLDI